MYLISLIVKLCKGKYVSKPSLRKLEADLNVNKTTLHNWKKNRPTLFNFIIESYKDKEILKDNLEYLLEQSRIIENEISSTKQRIT